MIASNTELMKIFIVLQVFDEYGNHLKENEIILLRLDGLSIQDRSGVTHGAVMESKKKVWSLVSRPAQICFCSQPLQSNFNYHFPSKLLYYYILGVHSTI